MREKYFEISLDCFLVILLEIRCIYLSRDSLLDSDPDEELLECLPWLMCILFGSRFCPQECLTRSIEIGLPSHLLSIGEENYSALRRIAT